MTSESIAPTVPLDAASQKRLAATGLELRAPSGEAEGDAFMAAMGRGFLSERPTDEQVVARRSTNAGERQLGVYDPASPDPHTPVATVGSWTMDVTVDAGSYLPMWAVSHVTVASTHRRRGIARALLEGELRSAVRAGIPIAGLTVSESTLYGRYGFGAATHSGWWQIAARRAGWVGPTPTQGQQPGRLDHIEREQLVIDFAALNEATRSRRPGEVSAGPNTWNAISGLRPGKPNPHLRGVRYTDADGVVRGAVAYTVDVNDDDYPQSTINVVGILTDGPDAHAALWRYVLEHDLIGKVTASLQPLDDPLRWMIADQRALTVTEVDHHWLRILDVRRCLQARTLRLPGQVSFVVDDPLGFASGTWLLTSDDDGAVTVDRADGPPNDADPTAVRLGISELSSLLLGGVRASTLQAAGRLDGSPATVNWLDVAFAPVCSPTLSIWY